MRINDLLRVSGTALALAIWPCLGIPAPAFGGTLQTAEEERANSAAPDTSAFSLRDDFEGELTLKWEPVRPDATHISLEKHPGMLTVTTQRGTIHGNEKADAVSEGQQAKNLYLIANPAPEGGDFVVTTRLASFAPTTYWHQAGLMVYDDDDNYVKCNLEWNDRAPSQVAPVILRETDQQPDFSSLMPKRPSDAHWLRVTKRGKLYQYAFSIDGEAFTVVGEKSWGDGAPKRIGLFAKNGGNPGATDIDAQFDFFEVRSLTGAEKSDPVYLERQKLQGVWEVESLKMSGETVADARLSRFVFDDGRLTIQDKNEAFQTEFTLDMAQQPNQLILSAFFSQEGTPVRAIYQFTEGNLVICLDLRQGASAPKELATRQGDRRLLVTLRRPEAND